MLQDIIKNDLVPTRSYNVVNKTLIEKNTVYTMSFISQKLSKNAEAEPKKQGTLAHLTIKTKSSFLCMTLSVCQIAVGDFWPTFSSDD